MEQQTLKGTWEWLCPQLAYAFEKSPL